MSDKPVTLITGASARIGRAMALGLGQAGWPIAVHYAGSEEAAKKVVQDIRAAGGTAECFQADLQDDAATKGLIGAVAANMGPVEILINNASVFQPDDVTDFEVDQWDAHFALHARAPALLTQHFVEHLPEAQQGLVINIIDQRVWRLTPKFFSYTLSKSTLWTMTQTMAQALAPRIRVNAIGPGPTLANERQSAEDFQVQMESVPLKKGADLSEFTETVHYLWRNRSITGQMIALDGGQHLAWETPDVVNAGE